MAHRTFIATPKPDDGIGERLELINTYHWGGNSAGDVWNLTWEEAEDLLAKLSYAITKRNRRCECCGERIAEEAECHLPDHRAHVCKKCDGDLAHIWPKRSLG